MRSTTILYITLQSDTVSCDMTLSGIVSVQCAVLSRASAARSNSRCYAELRFLELSFLSCFLGGCRSDWLPGSERERPSTLVFSCGWLVLRGHLLISFPEGDFAYGEGWPAGDVSVSCCIAGVGWAPSTVVSQMVVWL